MKQYKLLKDLPTFKAGHWAIKKIIKAVKEYDNV